MRTNGQRLYTPFRIVSASFRVSFRTIQRNLHMIPRNLAPVILKHYDFVLWLLPHLSKFPRDQKFLLGDRIELITLDILGHLMTANYSSARRRESLTLANLELDKLRILARLCKDLNLFSAKAYGYQAGAVDEIGRMIGGWLRSQAGTGVGAGA
ncbi:MAG: diversity-generating retroelement protein Avd [Candidatus Peribacteraceae bacterium]|nr:diversity-generating retroelement protein Avd [Candidatus Peribacteraceae bacterium]